MASRNPEKCLTRVYALEESVADELAEQKLSVWLEAVENKKSIKLQLEGSFRYLGVLFQTKGKWAAQRKALCRKLNSS